MGRSEGSSRGKYIAIQAYLKKEEQSQMSSLKSKLLKIEKEQQMMPKVSRRRDIIKIREEINKIENKTIEKINATKSWFFEKINKIDKPLARLIKKEEKRINTHQQNQKRERKNHDGPHRNTKNY